MLASGTCGGSHYEPQFVKQSVTRPRWTVQETLDACIAANDTRCIELCRQIFSPYREPGWCCEHTIEGEVPDDARLRIAIATLLDTMPVGAVA